MLQVGARVRDIQVELPSARVVYCSATGASGAHRQLRCADWLPLCCSGVAALRPGPGPDHMCFGYQRWWHHLP